MGKSIWVEHCGNLDPLHPLLKLAQLDLAWACPNGTSEIYIYRERKRQRQKADQ